MCLRRLGCGKEGVGERKDFKEKEPVSPINIGEIKISLPLSLHPTVSVSFCFLFVFWVRAPEFKWKQVLRKHLPVHEYLNLRNPRPETGTMIEHWKIPWRKVY